MSSINGAGFPPLTRLDRGHVEVAFPASLLRANPKPLTVEWVDSYR